MKEITKEEKRMQYFLKKYLGNLCGISRLQKYSKQDITSHFKYILITDKEIKLLQYCSVVVITRYLNLSKKYPSLPFVLISFDKVKKLMLIYEVLAGEYTKHSVYLLGRLNGRPN